MRGVGYHQAAWRHPNAKPEDEMSIRLYQESAQTAERGLFDMIFFADGIGVREKGSKDAIARFSTISRIDPLMLLPALAMVTKNIGLAATVSTTYNEPYNVARRFASLDHISSGRACWNVVTSWSDAEAHNFGLDAQLDKTHRYHRAHEFVEVAFGLWDSWESGALEFNKAHGRFFDPYRVHDLDHEGDFFKVKGPLNVSRCPQGRPVICQAGASKLGQDMAAEQADVVFCGADSVDSARDYYSSVKGRLENFNRTRDDILVMPGVSVIVGDTEAEAQGKYQYLQSLIHPDAGRAMLEMYMMEVPDIDVDEPLPKSLGVNTRLSMGEAMRKLADEPGMTLRRWYENVANARGHVNIIGTPEQVAEKLAMWIDTNAADGFIVAPSVVPNSIDEFVDKVIPVLQDMGRYRTQYEGSTLRENLGLRTPVNRFSTVSS